MREREWKRGGKGSIEEGRLEKRKKREGGESRGEERTKEERG